MYAVHVLVYSPYWGFFFVPASHTSPISRSMSCVASRSLTLPFTTGVFILLTGSHDLLLKLFDPLLCVLELWTHSCSRVQQLLDFPFVISLDALTSILILLPFLLALLECSFQLLVFFVLREVQLDCWKVSLTDMCRRFEPSGSCRTRLPSCPGVSSEVKFTFSLGASWAFSGAGAASASGTLGAALTFSAAGAASAFPAAGAASASSSAALMLCISWGFYTLDCGCIISWFRRVPPWN